MTQQQHSITPPKELIEKWLAEPEYVTGWYGRCHMINVTEHRFSSICAKAAQWGADQELEACLNCVNKWGSSHNSFADELRAARRRTGG